MQPVRVVSSRRVQLRSAEVLASLGVTAAAVTLVVLVWLVVGRSIEAEQHEVRARVEAMISGQSLVLADQIRQEMQSVEQSLRILKTAFQADPTRFDMRAWREQMPALTDLTDDAFIADETLVIRHALQSVEVGLPVGTRIGGMVGPLPERLDRDDVLFIGAGVEKLLTRQQVAFLMMRLERPGGWLVGATYRTTALTRLFAAAKLGVEGMTALIDTRAGRVQAITGPAAASPTVDIARSAMYDAMKTRPDGTWIGPSAPDGVQRIHAFHRVPGRQHAVVVAVDADAAMQPAATLAAGARAVAVAATLVVLAAAGLALYAVWTFRAKRRLRQALDREQQLVANAQVELSDARGRVASRGGHLRALCDAIDEGVLALDADLHVTEWNRAVADRLCLAPGLLRPGLPLDEVLRMQARDGAFGPLEDVEAEVGRRVTQLSTPTAGIPQLQVGPDGRLLAIVISRQADGSLLLVVREARDGDVPEPAEAATVPGSSAAPAAGSVETL